MSAERTVDAFVAEPGPGDCPRCGKDSCPGDCFRFRRADDVIREPRPRAVVEGAAWSGRTTVLVSESGAGKTFVVLDLAAAVADGRPWHGRAVERGSVAYVSFEGDALGLRLRALREAGYTLDDLHVLRASAPVSPRVERDGTEVASMGEAQVSTALADLSLALAAQDRPPVLLVIVDTVRASMTGSEDSSEHVSAYLRAVTRMTAAVPLAARALVHHAGWQDATETRRRRERGSSAFRGNVDATVYLEVASEDRAAGVAYLELRALKVRDEDRPAPLRLVRRRVELLATDGDPRRGPATSCVIERDERTAEDRAAATAGAQDVQDAKLDDAVLAVVRDHQAQATSVRRIREYVARGYQDVSAAVARLLTAGRLLPPERQRGPYRLPA